MVSGPSASYVPSTKNFSKSLGSLLRHMEGIEVIVELKTGKRCRGILASTDDYMNLSLDDAQQDVPTMMRPAGGKEMKEDFSSCSAAAKDLSKDDVILSSLDIRGASIRYIHFPDNADLSSLVRTGVDRERTAVNKYNRGKRKK